jgi:hypothetical protein
LKLCRYTGPLTLIRRPIHRTLAESADASLAGPPRIMAERAATFAKEPPPVPWDGVWVLTGK